jgi:serine protease Do
MKRQIKQLFMLSGFAGVCMAVGMGLSYHWVAKAQEEQPVVVDAKGVDRLPPIAEVAEKLNPTVVAITNTSFVKNRVRPGQGSPFGDDFLPWFFGPQRPGNRDNQDEEQRVQAGGSGVVISPDGEILTNNHVIDGIRGGETSIEVKMADGRTFKATILGKDKELDIALIKIDARHLPFAKLGDSDAMRIGEWVVAIGNPLGLEHTVTQGIISAKGRQISTGLESFLQTDAAINRGNSGGPLLNLRGEIIGINTAIRADGQNIGFAVPVNMIKRIIADLKSGKPVSRGYLGVGTRAMDNEFAASLGIKEGAVVANVDRGTPADKAGIQRLDVITAVEGQKIRTSDELVAAIAGRKAGEAVAVTVWRDGAFKQIKVILGDRRDLQKGEDSENEDEGPAPKETDSAKPLNLEKSYGFTVEALTPANRHQYGVPNDAKGVVVTFVAARSGAAEKGLQPGLIITSVGPKDVEGLQEFNQEVKKAGGKKPLLLQVRDPRGPSSTLAIPPR